MNLSIDIQKACASEDSPDEDSIKRWISAAIRDERDESELSIRIVDEQESSTSATAVKAVPPMFSASPLMQSLQNHCRFSAI
jgi:hypothetical protein